MSELPATPEQITVPSEVVYSPRRSKEETTGVMMRVSEWYRIKKLAERIQPILPIWGFGAALFAGVGLSSLVNWLVALGAENRDANAIWINGSVGFGSLALAVACLIADNQQRRQATTNAEDLLREMDSIERSNPGSFPAVPPQE